MKGENLPEPGFPESFNVLVKELQALGIHVTLGQRSRANGFRTGTWMRRHRVHGAEE